MSDEIITNLGPLAALAGVWESDQGVDTSRIHGEKTIKKLTSKHKKQKKRHPHQEIRSKFALKSLSLLFKIIFYF